MFFQPAVCHAEITFLAAPVSRRVDPVINQLKFASQCAGVQLSLQILWSVVLMKQTIEHVYCGKCGELGPGTAPSAGPTFTTGLENLAGFKLLSRFSIFGHEVGV